VDATKLGAGGSWSRLRLWLLLLVVVVRVLLLLPGKWHAMVVSGHMLNRDLHSTAVSLIRASTGRVVVVHSPRVTLLFRVLLVVRFLPLRVQVKRWSSMLRIGHRRFLPPRLTTTI
jgi:hypothetical protein